jgi:D-tyrosyl-tRNA(Tyr) deacylase
MRAVIQKVSSSQVEVDGIVTGSIQRGFNVLLGIAVDDTDEDIRYIADKIAGLRVFEDQAGKMNVSMEDIKGEILLISQFTLYGDARKGRRPSFIKALGGDEAKLIYERMAGVLREKGFKVETGIFGANMQVTIVNDGPVTILLDSQKTF